MYDTVDIINLINTGTIYTAERAKAKEPVQVPAADLPKIYVGFRGLNSKNPTSAAARNLTMENGENLVQTFDIQINCAEIDLPGIWLTVYRSLVGKNTRPLEEQVSGLTYQQGGTIGLENGTIWWLDRWNVDFPSINIF